MHLWIIFVQLDDYYSNKLKQAIVIQILVDLDLWSYFYYYCLENFNFKMNKIFGSLIIKNDFYFYEKENKPNELWPNIYPLLSTNNFENTKLCSVIQMCMLKWKNPSQELPRFGLISTILVVFNFLNTSGAFRWIAVFLAAASSADIYCNLSIARIDPVYYSLFVAFNKLINKKRKRQIKKRERE